MFLVFELIIKFRLLTICYQSKKKEDKKNWGKKKFFTIELKQWINKKYIYIYTYRNIVLPLLKRNFIRCGCNWIGFCPLEDDKGRFSKIVIVFAISTTSDLLHHKLPSLWNLSLVTQRTICPFIPKAFIKENKIVWNFIMIQ